MNLIDLTVCLEMYLKRKSKKTCNNFDISLLDNLASLKAPIQK